MKYLFILCSFCALLTTLVHAEDPQELLPFRIVNTTTYDDSEVFITISGFNEHPLLASATSPRRQGFIQFTHPSNGLGNFIPADINDHTTYSYPLSSFPHSTENKSYYEITLPYIDSGQIFFSLGSPLSLYVGMPAPPSPQYATIANPSPGDTNDPNFNILYDKMELSFEPPHLGTPPLNQITVNVTAVDFFAIPMYITLTGANPGTTGIQASRSTIIQDIQTEFSSAVGASSQKWTSLILKKNDSSILRILSPGNGLGFSFPPIASPKTLSYLKQKYKLNRRTNGRNRSPQNNIYFDNQYLRNLLVDVWNGPAAYYKNPDHFLTVTTLVSGTTYYGLVNTTSNAFEFWTSKDISEKPAIRLPAPALTGESATNIIFEAIAPWPKITPATQDAYDIGRLVQAGIMTGYLPCSGSSILSKETLVAAAAAGSLYKVNSNLSPALQASGPWYDLYSAAIFPNGNGAYTWAWDDLVYLSAAPSLATWQPDTYIEIQLGNCQ